MRIIKNIKNFIMRLFGQSKKEDEKEIHERIMKKRAKAYEELARY